MHRRKTGRKHDKNVTVTTKTRMTVAAVMIIVVVEGQLCATALVLSKGFACIISVNPRTCSSLGTVASGPCCKLYK